MKNRKLVVFAFDYPPSQGGIARLCSEIVKNSLPFFSKVTVLTRSQSSNTANDSDPAIEIIELPSRRILCEWRAFRYLRRLRKHPDVDVICGLWHPEAALCRLAAVPNIYILAHGGELLPGSSSFRKHIWLPLYTRWVISRKCVVVANSGFTAALAKKISRRASIKVVPLGVDTQLFSPTDLPKDSDNTILQLSTVSRLQRHKGHLNVLNALVGLPSEIRNKIRWKIAGTGPYEITIRDEISRLGLMEQVSLVGYVPDSKLPDFYRSSDVFILFSQNSAASNNVEGFGLVFLEAQSCGIPVIGARSGGIEDAVIPGKGGWLLDQDDTAGLKKLIQQLIEKPSLIEAQGKRSRERVLREADWSHYMENLMKAIH